MTMLAISQKPERVSNILRSSTPISRVSGMRARCRPLGAGAVGVVSTAMAVMLLLLLVGCRR